MEAILIEIRDLLKDFIATRRVPDVEERVGETNVKRNVDESTQCVGFTAKGNKCTNRAIGSSEYCGMHGGNKKRKVVVGSSTKSEKIIPVHTHHTDPERPCDLCIQHGDSLEPTAPDASYSVAERLKEMLANETF